MIVKVQVPISYNTDKPLALIYNKDRSVEVYIECSKELMDRMAGELRVFFKAEIVMGQIVLLEKVPDWSW